MDNDTDSSLCRQCVRTYEPFELNEEVDVADNNALYSRGVVVAVHADDSYDVQMGGNVVLPNIPSTRMRRFTPDDVVEPGMPVTVDDYASGIIVHVNDDDSYDIQYDDGDYEPNVPYESIQFLEID
jgi:hypothetical protein